ncbi:MAG: hypothetical protein C6W57_16660 [Caldibacillus debilis]|nr:MAG: hypothetical protein C6W57_16660 [Caldibacillus debilis]REJ26702.1 MAG: hypothetical protein C6W56_11670 [Caldibacillus debilis]
MNPLEIGRSKAFSQRAHAPGNRLREREEGGRPGVGLRRGSFANRNPPGKADIFAGTRIG